MPKLTKPFIQSIRPGPRDVFVWDETLPGFGLRVKPSGVRSFVIQYRNSSGISRRLTIGRYGVLTLDEARREALALLKTVELGGDPARERRDTLHAVTIAQLAERYMEQHCQGRCKPSTMAAHQWLLDKFIVPALGKQSVKELTTGQVQHLHQDLRETPYNANRVLGLLRAMLNAAERWDLIPPHSNPAARIKPFTERKRQRYLTPEELVRLEAAIEHCLAEGSLDLGAAAAIRLLLLTGCRLSEILTLEWSAVDLAGQKLLLARHKTDGKGIKGVPLNGAAVDILSRLPRVAGCPYVIPGRVAGRHLVNLQKPWRRVRTVAALPDLRIHDLRHSFASFAAGAGLSLPVIGALLGHSSPATTNRYAHLATDPLREASDRIGQAMAAAHGRAGSAAGQR